MALSIYKLNSVFYIVTVPLENYVLQELIPASIMSESGECISPSQLVPWNGHIGVRVRPEDVPPGVLSYLIANRLYVPPIARDYTYLTRGINPASRPDLRPSIHGALVSFGHSPQAVEAFLTSQGV